VGQIGCNTWSVDDIIQCQFGDERRCLEEEGQWLLRNCQQLHASSSILKENPPVQFHQTHQRRLNRISIHPNILFYPSANIPALIPIIAASAMIEFCPTRSTLYPALLAIASLQKNPTYLN
jgi:hypothetical protein